MRDLDTTYRGWLGLVVMTVGAMFWAASSIVVKRVRWRVSATVVVGWQALIGGLPVIVAGAAQLPDLRGATWETVLATIYVIVVGIAFAHWLYFKILQLVPVWVASLSTLAIPAVGVVSGAVALDEPLGPIEVLALLLLVGGVSTVLPRPGASRSGP